MSKTLEEMVRTGSVSQDALRLGFQTTCEKGIATLLKVDDITVEECADFLERHKKDIENELSLTSNWAGRIANKYSDDFHSFGYWEKDRMKIIRHPILRFKRLFQAQRAFECTHTKTCDPVLNVRQGQWETSVEFTLVKRAWTGVDNGKVRTYPETTEIVHRHIKTEARKCVVYYQDYDKYSAKFVPDEAAEAAYDAVTVGMAKLKVATPKIINGGVTKDPIIVGFVDNQMFIIAWFGYKKEKFSCNT